MRATAALLCALVARVLGCPNECSMNGICSDEHDWQCLCDEGFTGPDCSQRVCPAGTAWADWPSANQTAHAELVECSGFGYCDRAAGECVCRPGFTGHACNRMMCAQGSVNRELCSGHDRCLSMAKSAEQVDYVWLWRVGEYSGWDKDQIFGCACDVGFSGYDCSEMLCPAGDDPITAGVSEVQLVDCACDVDPCNGTVSLTFRGQTTRPIPHDAGAIIVERRLRELPTVNDASVVFARGDGAELCRPAARGGNTALITFYRLQQGEAPDLGALSASSSAASTKVVTFYGGANSELHPKNVSVRGTREHAECSNRGTCDRETGICNCYKDFESSDGRGKLGALGDCGYYNGTGLDRCPAAVGLWGKEHDVCSGLRQANGYRVNCTADFKCNCTAGYSGTACEYLDCPRARPWHDEAVDGVGHHNKTACSSRGLCDREKGECSCDVNGLFEGAACEKMSCALNNSLPCGGLGECATMAKRAKRARDAQGQLAAWRYTDAWDAYKIRTCVCDEKYGVYGWNASDIAYRGPQAFAYTDFTGFDCSKAFCPTGDNPWTAGVNEVQAVNCSGKHGYFYLSLRDKATTMIAYDASLDEVQALLEKSKAIGRVRLAFTNRSDATYVCDPSNVLEVEFLTELGDLPALRWRHAKGSHLAQPDINVTVTELVKGTKEDLECAQMGVCNRDTGHCYCMPGLASSSAEVETRADGVEGKLGRSGERGDCGHRHTSTEAYNIDMAPGTFQFALGGSAG